MTLQAPPDPKAASPVAAALREDAAPRLHGVIEVIRPDRIAGWAIDRADARAHVEVEVRREGKLVATVRADRPRPDLERGGIGTGRYGFSAPLDPPLGPGMEFTLSVTARAADGATATLRPAGQAAGASSPDRRLLERVFEDLGAVRAAAAENGAALAGGLDRLLRAMERIELVQVRLEAALAAVEPPRRRSQAPLWILGAIALLTGAGSLALGAWSIWWA